MTTRRILLIAALLACAPGVQAQPPAVLDSLLAVLEAAKHDTVRLQVLCEVADITRIRPVDEQYYTGMVQLVERLEKEPDVATRRIAQRGRVHLLLWAGRRSSRATNYRQAARHYDQAAGMATAQ
ncbi:MAG: hypothetical protein JSS84_07985, partial [Bacteroidetes bacterium]|nr:hypothetical protein [Bacteroidota bacterium]